LDRLRLELSRLPWIKREVSKHGSVFLTNLAVSLLSVVEQAKHEAPRMKRLHTDRSDRKRRPGGGRKPDINRGIMLAAIAGALVSVGVKPSKWIADKSTASPLYSTARICWKVATGKTVTDMRRSLGWEIFPIDEATPKEAQHFLGQFTDAERRYLPDAFTRHRHLPAGLRAKLLFRA
jgi:hypothetical protein